MRPRTCRRENSVSTWKLVRRGMIPLAAVTCVVLAACRDTVTSSPMTPARSDASENGAIKFWNAGAAVYWNEIARGTGDKYKPSQQFGVRALAYLSLAQYQAVVAAENGNDGSLHPSEQGAVAGASAAVLTWAFPAEGPALEALVASEAFDAQWPGATHTDFDAGVQLGRAVGAAVIASAATDQFTSAQAPVPVCDSCWHSLATPPAPPIFPRLGEMRPFFLTSGSQFRPGPPPAFHSAEFAAALGVDRQIADTRTPYQDSIAKFWAAPGGFFVAQNYANLLATQLITEFRLDERAAAHALALLNMTSMDAFIACHDAKYVYWLLRPSQADPLIKTAIPVPNHPSYPSNHACVTGSGMAVLAAMFPSRADYLNGLADQAGLSRVYAGIHYPFDVTTGLALGRTIAQWALAQDVHGREMYPMP